MSYCRFGEADIYLFADSSGGFTCCACYLLPKRFQVALSTHHGRKRFWPLARKPTRLKPVARPRGWLARREQLRTRSGVLAHLQVHRAHGDFVPLEVDEQLIAERAMRGERDQPYRGRRRIRERLAAKRKKPRLNRGLARRRKTQSLRLRRKAGMSSGA